MTHQYNAAPGLLDLFLHNGVRVRGRAELRLARGMHALAADTAPASARAVPVPGTQARPASNRSGLRALDSGDARMAQVVDKVGKVLGRGIPILIMGETGSGKEWLARAIHSDSPRAHKPFVALNCASIPEALIESELFGYEEGAFTGARKRGAPGKFQQADGGTLFLDEIGDMPFPLQARLLRVLQERTVTPLGSARPVELDVELVCASNHNLRQRIAGGLFRAAIMAGTDDIGLRHLPDDFLDDLSNTSADTSPDTGADTGTGAGTASAISPGTRLGDLARGAIVQALDAHGGNVSATARALGISRNTIYRKLPHLKQA
jgi:transcriptional regulator with PAS, ATPase and Fis domain